MQLHFFPFWVCDMHNRTLGTRKLRPKHKSLYSADFLLSSVGCSGSPGAESCNAWLNWSLEEEARTTQWARKCSKNETQELPGSLFPIQDTGSGFVCPLISCESNKGWHRSPHAWFGDGLCISAFTWLMFQSTNTENIWGEGCNKSEDT